MSTVEEIRQWTPEQRREYFIAEVCRVLGITLGEISMNYNDDDTYTVSIYFGNPLAYAEYRPLKKDKFLLCYTQTEYFDSEQHSCLRTISEGIARIRNERRIAELERKVRWLESNTAKVLPTDDAIKDV